MYRYRHWPEEGAARQTTERQTASLAGIVVILVLLIGGLFLVQHLRTASRIEDCLLAGRRNCDSLVIHAHRPVAASRGVLGDSAEPVQDK